MDLNNYEFWRKNKRYLKALLAGLVSTIVSFIAISVIYGILQSFFSVIFGIDLLYVAAGYFIGECIRRFGHGVGKKFYITAAVYTLICIILARHFMYFGLILPTFKSFSIILVNMLNPSFNNILGLLWIAVALGTAYKSAESSR